MSAIQDSSYPLVFPVAAVPVEWQAIPPQKHEGGQADWLSLRTVARALDGMQKEAVVAYGPSGTAWRMVCDEGPYLNGTDLAPFPLAFFCTGMVSSFMTELLSLLKQRGITHRKLRLLQDNRYSMEGSALQGTMTGSALPVELQLELETAASPATLQQVLTDAVAASPAGALLRFPLDNSFSILWNGQALATRRVRERATARPVSPEGFARLQPALREYPDDIICKLKAAQQLMGVAGGIGSSLAENQKRILHMRGICQVRDDGLLETTVELYQPLGSRFRFLAENSASSRSQERAPDALAYLSAGLAFCYMTQVGRYCSITKQPLASYRIVQDACFSRPGASGGSGQAARMAPIATHVYLEGSQDPAFAQTLVDMSEQTCFLHAACRNTVKIKLKHIA